MTFEKEKDLFEALREVADLVSESMPFTSREILRKSAVIGERLITAAEVATSLELGCSSPVSDSDGDGVWSTQTWINCGECDACRLSAALEAVGAPL